eukprot:TRINITY_DN1944_c0_g1_i1.p1 TRINITY_DN1944_c0_g1~~TRINITY_DN1944_c0_g1_i1.p1  ORF type:complete len:272 (-),score=64.17 TRINITY_DN1944_c0_g1_i1:1150-1917(-)
MATMAEEYSARQSGMEQIRDIFVKCDRAYHGHADVKGKLPLALVAEAFARLDASLNQDEVMQFLKPFELTPEEVSYDEFLNAVLIGETFDGFNQLDVVTDIEPVAPSDRPKRPPRPNGACRARARDTVTSYEVLGACADDSAETLKTKYRGELLKNHPDKGGEQEDFVEVQKAADKLASKRSSFAVAIGRPAVATAAAAAAQGDLLELEGTMALEAGHAALEPGQQALEAGHAALEPAREALLDDLAVPVAIDDL